MPSGFSILSHPENDRFHLVRQHRLRNTAEVLERMDQAAQETVDIAPFGKFDVHHPGIPQHHRILPKKGFLIQLSNLRIIMN